MSYTATKTTASHIRLDADHLGISRGGDAPTESLSITNKLLQQNHETLHIFFRDMNGHNHLVHNLLTRLALGASPSELQTAYDDDFPTQRPMPPLDNDVVSKLSDPDYFYERITKIDHYTNFLVFFEQQIAKKGWKEVVNEYVFCKGKIAEALLPLMYDGAYHSIIHLGLGAEFEQPTIIAEALAQAASHDSFDTKFFFNSAEERAKSSSKSKSLVDLAKEAKVNETIRAAAQTEGLIGTMKQKKAIYPKAVNELLDLAAQFRVTPETLEQKTAEMISFVAYLAGAAQRPGKVPKIDFFFMHCVTSSIFFTVLTRQDWISMENKVRLVEWKGRLDLTWYVTCGAPDLYLDDVINYKGPKTGDIDWTKLFRLINEQHDDGHVAKFVRALKNGQNVSKKFENGEASDAFPIKGDLWLKIARMSYDTTLGLPLPAKWVIMVGMESKWAQVPNAA